MIESEKLFHLHLVSDSTGETAENVARACLAQFRGVRVKQHEWILIRSQAQLKQVIEGVMLNPGMVFCTMVDEAMVQELRKSCWKYDVPFVSVLDPILHSVANWLGVKSQGQPGRQHILDEGYFSRIDAMQFALAHDDGQNLATLHKADVILIGVSRTSKTPTCVYLAHRGFKAANIPFVPNIPLPEELFSLKEGKPPLIVGLTREPSHLIQFRNSRLDILGGNKNTDYVNLDQVRQEVLNCRKLYVEQDWPIIDVTRRSVEETAATIISRMTL